MKYDEFAFVNQQLAGMLRSGIPLEGALRQLCAAMRRGRLRTELELLEADLAKGTPLNQALAGRKLPDLYRRMLQVGVESNDLPGTLTLLADYYQKTSLLWMRLKAVMIYPTIVLFGAFALSIFLVQVYGGLGFGYLGQVTLVNARVPAFFANPYARQLGLFLPPLVLFALICGAVVTAVVPPIRRRLIWLVPGFKDASLSRLASALNLMLKSGCSVKTALGLIQKLEAQSPIGAELKNWEERVAQGRVKFNELATGKSTIPPLFVWLVAADGDDWEPGLARAAEIYYHRAVYRADLLLNSALPVSVVFLGMLIATQLFSLIQLLNGGIVDNLMILRSF